MNGHFNRHFAASTSWSSVATASFLEDNVLISTSWSSENLDIVVENIRVNHANPCPQSAEHYGEVMISFR